MSFLDATKQVLQSGVLVVGKKDMRIYQIMAGGAVGAASTLLIDKTIHYVRAEKSVVNGVKAMGKAMIGVFKKGGK